MTRVCAFAVVLALAAPVLADDWPQWLGPDRDGSTVEKVMPWKGDLKILWKVGVGDGHSSPVVLGDRVYLHAVMRDKEMEVVDCFDTAKGSKVWHHEYGRPEFKGLFGRGPRATPSVVNGKVYTYGASGVLSCLDAKSGDLVWRLDTRKEFQPPPLKFGVSSSPLVIGDKVLVAVGAKGASVVAVDKDKGKVLWKSLDDKATYSSPITIGASKDPTVAFLTYDGLVGLRGEDGALLWRFPFVDKLAESSTTPARVGDNILISSITRGAALVAFGTEGGKTAPKQVWFEKDLTCYFATPVPVGSEIYMVTGALGFGPAVSTLRCIEAASGKELWKKPNVGQYHASLVQTGNGKLLMVEESGKVVLIDPDPKAYRELARAPICGKTWAHPAVADGRLFIRDDTQLVCVELPK